MNPPLPPLLRTRHGGHCLRCIGGGLSSQFVEVDTSRMTLAYYCLSALDLLDLVDAKVKEQERLAWRTWIWQQQISGEYGTAFRPGPSTSTSESQASSSVYDQPHLINTYTAILSLCILRDDLSQLDRPGLLKFLRSTQQADGSFTPSPGWGEADVRIVYCAFIISHMLNDWSGVDVPKAISFIQACRTYECGYGQTPGNEANGGPTYCSLACLALAPKSYNASLTPTEHESTLRWLTQRQIGGFQGRAEKTPDACYSFWCGAAIQILGAGDLIDADANAAFLYECQFKFGGIAKGPNENPDPFHTYMSLASLSLNPPTEVKDSDGTESWTLAKLHPLVNARVETAQWAMERVPQEP